MGSSTYMWKWDTKVENLFLKLVLTKYYQDKTSCLGAFALIEYNIKGIKLSAPQLCALKNENSPQIKVFWLDSWKVLWMLGLTF